MKRLLVIICLVFVGCGYTTRGFHYDGNSIIIKPVANKIDITSESRRYSGYGTYPVLIENRLTNILVNKFNIDGGLKVVNDDPRALRLTCTITDYKKETLRYTDSDDVEEQRLRLYVRMQLQGVDGDTLQKKTIIGEASYFIVGPNQRSETAAQVDLIDDTARRIVEAVVEEW